jgi:hypothetical protein
MKKLMLSLLLSYGFSMTTVAQPDAYVAYVPPGGGSIKVMLLDVETCTFCNVAELPFVSPNGGQQYADILVLPDGRIVIIRSGISNAPIEIFTPPSQNPVVVLPPVTVTGMVIGPNGTVYVYASSGLYELDLNSNTLDFIGAWPSGINFVDAELYVYNGQIFGVNMNNQAQQFQIDVNNPSQSFFVSNIPLNGSTYSSVGHFGDLALLSQGPQFHTYNALTGVVDSSCNLAGIIAATTNAIAAIPEGGPLLACLCTTNAGTLPQAGPCNTCTNATLNFPPATGTVLDGNDILRYILFTNPSDTAGSIVAISATPSFTFAPPMETEVTYYIAAMAGNNLNGNVDLADPCLDFSNALQVVWRPLPAVTFSAANPNVCAGACTTVTANFTGTAPFTLTYTTPASGTVTQTFSGNTGTFQVCSAAGSPPGSLVVLATALVDAFCTCGP